MEELVVVVERHKSGVGKLRVGIGREPCSIQRVGRERER